MVKSSFRIPIWMAWLNWGVTLILTGFLFPLTKGHWWSYNGIESIRQYFYKVLDVIILSGIFTFLPFLLVIVTLLIFSMISLRKWYYWMWFMLIQFLLAVVTFFLLNGSFSASDEVFTAGVLILSISMLSWTVTFLLKKEEISGLKDVIDENMMKE